MSGGHLFHLNLHLTVGRIDIIKLFFTRGTHITLHLGIEHFIKMEQLSLSAEIETQVIESTIFILCIGRLMGPLAQQIALQQPQSTEVEIITDGTQLIVNHGVFLGLPFIAHPFLFITVGIDHGGPTVLSHFDHTLQGSLTQLDSCILDHKGHIGRLRLGSNLTQSLTGPNSLRTKNVEHQRTT